MNNNNNKFIPEAIWPIGEYIQCMQQYKQYKHKQIWHTIQS